MEDTDVYVDDIIVYSNDRGSHLRAITALFVRLVGGDPGVVASTAAFHARVRGSVPGLGGL